jgi:hypothetical protein
MSTGPLAIVFAGMSAMLLFASPWAASADELNTADDDLALPDQPAGNETLAKQSGSSPTPVNIVDTNNNVEQQQQNSIVGLPTTMTMAITKSGTIAIGNESSSASITSSASATVIHSGMQQTP